eukprot:tig00000215_g18564.t1
MRRVSISPDGSHVATSGGGGVKVWGVADGALAADLPVPLALATAWSPRPAAGGSSLELELAIAAADSVHIYRTADWSPTVTLGLPFGARRVAFAGEDLLVATDVDGATLRVWDLRRGAQLHALREPMAGGAAGAFTELDAARVPVDFEFDAGAGVGVGVGVGDRELELAVVGTDGPRAHLVDLRGGTFLVALPMPEGPVDSVAVHIAGNVDGRRGLSVSAAGGGSVRTWSLELLRIAAIPAAMAIHGRKRAPLESETIVIEGNTSTTCELAHMPQAIYSTCTVAFSGYTGAFQVFVCNASVPDISYSDATPGCNLQKK